MTTSENKVKDVKVDFNVDFNVYFKIVDSMTPHIVQPSL